MIGPDEQHDVSFGGFFEICNPFSSGPYYRYDPGRCSKDAIPVGDITNVSKVHLIWPPLRPKFDPPILFAHKKLSPPSIDLVGNFLLQKPHTVAIRYFRRAP